MKAGGDFDQGLDLRNRCRGASGPNEAHIGRHRDHRSALDTQQADSEPCGGEMTPKTTTDHPAEGASNRPCVANTAEPSVKKRTEMITAPSSIQSQLSQTPEKDTGARRSACNWSTSHRHLGSTKPPRARMVAAARPMLTPRPSAAGLLVFPTSETPPARDQWVLPARR